jgi:vanillate/3-O-methylgallate O-demethylase
MKAYREWLPATAYEAVSSLGGSYVSKNIEDYYVTPYEMGYGSFVKFDHDFIGREALEKMKDQPHRQKVTFEWNSEDVVDVFRSMFEDGPIYRYIDQPNANYGSSSFDSILVDGKVVGASMFSGYSYNERRALSLGIVDPEFAKPGTQVTLVWGENPNTKKTTTEPHRQKEIRAIVAAVPYNAAVRDGYYPAGWRVTGKL